MTSSPKKLAPLVGNADFTYVSILLPVMNEVASLAKTIEIIETACGSEIGEYILVVCGKTTNASLKACESYAKQAGGRFVLLHQKLPFLGGAVRDAFRIVRGSHVVMMASDLETDPYLVAELIRRAKEKPKAVITTTRWRGNAKFVGYHPLKLVANFMFQKLFSWLYGTHLSDMTYGFRILPSALVKSIAWEELRHPFLFETLLKPLRMGVEIDEIPATWTCRTEGESQAPPLITFAYIKTGLKFRFQPVKKFLIGKDK